jgi:hypothetical protein
MPDRYRVSFRTARSGGDVDINQAIAQAERLRGLPHLIFLLHGYNNDQHDADIAYDAFCKREQSLVRDGGDWAPGAAVVQVYWPGDARWWIASALYYPFAVPRALQVGKALGAILDDLGGHSAGLLIADFVAHSLGNRVLLHTLANLRGASAVWVRRVVHMAGAVPTWTLESAARIEPLRAPLLRECATSSRATSLYSGSDDVLALAFPIGETAADTYDGELPVALGHADWNDGDRVDNFTQLEAVGAGHGNYWGAKKKTQRLDDWLRDTVNSSLDLANSATRNTPTRVSADRDLPDDRTLNERATEERTVGNSF